MIYLYKKLTGLVVAAGMVVTFACDIDNIYDFKVPTHSVDTSKTNTNDAGPTDSSENGSAGSQSDKGGNAFGEPGCTCGCICETCNAAWDCTGVDCALETDAENFCDAPCAQECADRVDKCGSLIRAVGECYDEYFLMI